MKYKCAPGIVLVEPIVSSSKIIINEKKDSKIVKGKVLAIGMQYTTLANAVLKPEWYCKIGDTVWFLTYNEMNDQFEEDGKKYFVVRFEDIRLVI